jgi:hypothetical protein
MPKYTLFFFIFAILSLTPSLFAQEQAEEEERPPYEQPQDTPRLATPRETELVMARKESKQRGVTNLYYKYWTGLKKEEILDFYRHMFPASKGYREERRGLPSEDAKRNHFFFMKGTEEFVFLGFFYESEASGKLTYLLNITKMSVAELSPQNLSEEDREPLTPPQKQPPAEGEESLP